MTMATKLEATWKECTSDLPRAVTESWWTNIVEKYTEEPRKFHNLQHLEDKMTHFESVKSILKNPKAVALAIIFNYYEYDPKSVDCETRNIAMFDKFAEDAEIPNESQIHQEVVSLLQAHATHSTDEHKTGGMFGAEDHHYFLDIDMTPLGGEPEDYALYSSKVQQEYGPMPANQYRTFRLRVLETFLMIPNIFATKEFREKFEEQARLNIAKEVSSLKA
ncbi:uncharacterized protein LOC113206845 [Frankliniella occidentalis]|uniref:Uncharacterized protein LOC113206845 n=1 Tax=Frankliniella occidentalis TaxID=133901 RepID=A0A6J1SHS6_FRAOC|nr:uncharacterized protein LOC113206845 [Frankliniella occidentalis]